jgi:hypothetical protein
LNFAELAFRRLDRHPGLRTAHYVAWAVRLLDEGCTAPSVAELASFSLEAQPGAEQVERTFLACVSELSLSLPSESQWHEALKAYVVDRCESLVRGKLTPEEVMSDLLRIADDNDDPYLLLIWNDLATDITEARSWPHRDPDHVCFNLGLDLSSANECIRMTAIQFAGLAARQLPDKFPAVWMCTRCGAVSEQAGRTAEESRDCPSCTGAAALLNMRHHRSREHLLACVALEVPERR